MKNLNLGTNVRPSGQHENGMCAKASVSTKTKWAKWKWILEIKHVSSYLLSPLRKMFSTKTFWQIPPPPLSAPRALSEWTPGGP